MDNIEKKHYEYLKKNRDRLIKLILGNDYYTLAIDFFDSDIEAFNDMIKEVNKLKYRLKMYKRLLYFMMVFTLILGVYLVIK